MPDEKLPSFVKALKEYMQIPATTAIAEFKALTVNDKIELSAMLMPIVAHEPYAPATATA